VNEPAPSGTGWPAVPPGGRLLALVGDLMDRSRVAAARPDAVFLPAGAPGLRGLTGLQPADVVLVDIGRAGVIEAAAGCSARLIGFVAHVDTATAEAARDGGIEVLARSAFFRRLGRTGGSEPDGGDGGPAGGGADGAGQGPPPG
jgi:hypothetical protein